MKAQYAILRFAKYKGPEIGHIESHNERTKEKYASNPDVDTSRSHFNFHLVTPQRKYRAEAEKQIAEAGCRTRSDSVRVVEALVTASPEFFKGKKKSEIKAYFQETLDFIREHQDPKTIISAVVHMDEKTLHMHLCFVPLTADGRLSAKAEKAGLSKILAARKAAAKPAAEAETVTAPPAEPCTASIPGIEVMDLEDAVQALWKAGIYAESGMGCTGPLVMMSEANHEKALEILKKAGYVG